MTEGPNTPPSGDAGASGAQPPNTPPPPGGAPPPPGGPPPAAPQGSFGSAQIGGPADLGMRVLAKLIDGVAVAIVYAVVVVPLTTALIFSGGGFFTGGGGFFTFSGIITNVISAAITVAYFTLMESQMGKTLGKMLLKLEVQGPDGNAPALDQAFKRNAYFLLTVVPFVGWLLQLGAMIFLIVSINNASNNQGWHDEFAGGTKVIRVG